MKKREVWLVILLVFFGFLYQAIQKGKIHLAEDFSFFSAEKKLKGSQFVEFPENEKVFSNVGKIEVENPAGEVVISKSGDDKVHISSSLRIYYTNKSDVDEIHKQILIKSELQNRELKISSQYANAFPYQRARILLRLSVPQNIILGISNQEGDTVIKDTGKDILIDQENGNLILENIPSSLRLQLRNCNANIKDIAANVDIVSSYANVFLENAASLRFKGRHSDCSVKNVKKDVFIEHSYGKLTLDGIDKVEISARHCDIAAKNIRNGAVINNNYENVFLENIGGDVRIICRLSKIDLHHVSCSNVVIENSFADTNISDFSGTNLDMLLKNGNLELQVKNVSNRINIDSQHAELNLYFGALSDPTFNIKAKHGNIQVQSPLELDIYKENVDSFANRAGQKPEVLINNTYGNIQINTLK